jgi:DNA modification methylase
MIKWHNEKRKIKELVPYVSNPRQITEKQAEDLKKSLDKFGLAASLVINTDNTIIGGHKRKKIMETLMQMPPDFEIDVRVPERELTIDEVRELNVRLNKNVAEWNFDTLANNFELNDLLDWGFEKSDLDLDLWMPDSPEDAEPQIDRAEELREIWGVETGQLWQLGEHRLICGDCTDKAVVERVMGGDLAKMVWTDPPYGVSYGDKLEASNPMGYRVRTIENDNLKPEELELFIRSCFRICADYTIAGAAIYAACPAGTLLPRLIAAFTDSGFEFRWGLVWVKDQIVLSRADYHFQHENILYGWKPDGAHHWHGDRKQSSCMFVDRPKSSEEHPTMKPIELVEIMLKNNSEIDDVVLEPFSGSGTTLIACERLNRKCRAVEISPAYVAVAIQRWVDVTGGEPVLVE